MRKIQITQKIFKKKVEMINKYMKHKDSTSLAMKEMQIKPTRRSHFAPTRQDKNFSIFTLSHEIQTIRSYIQCNVQILGKLVGHSPVKLKV